MRIQYCHSLLESLEDAAGVPLQDMPVDGVPDRIRDIIKNHKAFSESNTFGRPGVGEPEEYEKLIISEDNQSKTFEYFNKGIHFVMAGTEKDRPVFQVFAYFMSQTRATS